MNQVKIGTVEGTGAAINIECGFNPDYVKVLNIDSATLEELEWFKGMADASAIKKTGTPTRTKITTLGISAYAGVSGSNSLGFTIGADLDVNVVAETIYYLAIRD